MSAARKRTPKDQLAVIRLCKTFLAAPTKPDTLESLCRSLVGYELAARIKAKVAEAEIAVVGRAEVKAEELCRKCRVPLLPSNRASVSGYLCRTCKRENDKEYQAQRRARLKAEAAA